MNARFKYPKTMHLPFSPGLQNDDRVIQDLSELIGQDAVATLKYDGEGTSMYSDGMHARSIDSRHHPSRDWVKKFHSEIAYRIPDGLRICGENVYAQHSIIYDDLDSYFYGFNAWRGDTCLSWDETIDWFFQIGIRPVKVLFRGIFDEQKIIELCKKLNPEKDEGLVVRVAGEIKLHEWQVKAAKYVRRGHVQTDQHWMQKEVIPNGLRK